MRRIRPVRARHDEPHMTLLKWLLGVVVLCGGFVAVMYVAQRSLQYFPDKARLPPAAANLSQAEEIVLDTPDGEQIIVWHVPPREGHPVVLYMHIAEFGYELVDKRIGSAEIMDHYSGFEQAKRVRQPVDSYL